MYDVTPVLSYAKVQGMFCVFLTVKIRKQITRDQQIMNAAPATLPSE